MPIFLDAATREKWAGQTGSVADSTCGGLNLAFALVPGPIFNAIKTVTLERGVLFKAMIIQPVPEPVADTSITYQGMHPASYEALSAAGFQYSPQSSSETPAPGADGDTAAALEDEAGEPAPADEEGTAFGLIPDFVYDWVDDAVNLAHGIPGMVRGWLGGADCLINGCVNLTVRLDLRNTDADFGGPIAVPAGSATDTSTALVRAWGARAGSQMQLPGVKVIAKQTADALGIGIPTSYDGTTNDVGTATFQVGKGRSTDICLLTENAAGQIRTATWTKEICQFAPAATQWKLLGHAVVTTAAPTSFNADTSINVKLQNKYFNMLAQFTDGRAYLQQVVGYTPRQVKVLTGPAANVLLPLVKGRAVTPCLAFPNGALALLHGIIDKTAALAGPVAGPIISLAAHYAEAVYEVDMWMPDGGDLGTKKILEDRTVPTHEYGHFAMCALLYDEDRTKAVAIPSLLIQRIAEGTYMDVGDETTRIMEAFADYFAGQVASGYNYFWLENGRSQDNIVSYCDGGSSSCWDFNYVEDTNMTPDPYNSTTAQGTPNQMRRVATTMLDAFDGHTGRGDNPGSGDFWTWNGARFVPSTTPAGDAKDEPIVLAGPALRTLIHNWTHASWLPVAWAVNEQQFFGALNATIRNTPKDPSNPASKYTWCDACQLFAPHDGRSCAAVGATATNGECVRGGAAVSASMSMPQMVAICAQDPIKGFIGAPPAATDPTATCTFTGCAAHTILVGTPGDTTAACVACGPHQISVGNRTCSDCAGTNVGASSCMECGADQIVGGSDRNTCVACPARQIPNADRNACIACAPHQIAAGGACVACAASQVATLQNTCEACPAGQIPYRATGGTGPEPQFGDSCVPVEECTCGFNGCRKVGSNGICHDVIG